LKHTSVLSSKKYMGPKVLSSCLRSVRNSLMRQRWNICSRKCSWKSWGTGIRSTCWKRARWGMLTNISNSKIRSYSISRNKSVLKTHWKTQAFDIYTLHFYNHHYKKRCIKWSITIQQIIGFCILVFLSPS